MTMPTISVIIPIYNMALYLRQCVDSVVGQDYEEVETILVNDGSEDESLAMCRQYEATHKNIIVVDKENGGLSDARNAGMAVARGEYIYFLDGDDWLAPNALSTLYDCVVKMDCEVVQGGVYYAYSDHLYYDGGGVDETTTLSCEEAMKELVRNRRIKNFAWGKLYRADIVKRHPFPVGKYFEDSYWQHLVVNETTRYGIVPTPLYYYRQRVDSISGVVSEKGLDLLKGQEERLRFVRKEYPSLTKDMLRTYLNTTYSYLRASYRAEDRSIRGMYATYWQEMTEQYGNEMEQELGREYTHLRSAVRWHLATAYDLYRSVKGKIRKTT